MVAHVPVLVIMGALKAVQQQTDNRREVGQQSIELMRLQVQAETLDRRHERQAKLLGKLAQIGQQMHDKKVDAILEVFKGVKEVLLDQQNIFRDEKSQITQASFSASSEAFVLIQKRQSEIDRELHDIRHALDENANAAYAMIAEATARIPTDMMSEIEDLRS